MKKLFLLLLLASQLIAYSQYRAIVLKVKDGDTIEVLENDTELKTLRLADIDAPEKSQPFGIASKTYLESIILGQYVQYDIVSKDKYGRIIAKVYLANHYISEAMITAGYAWYYQSYSKNIYLKYRQNEAQIKGIGMWSSDNNVEPWIYRKNKKRK